MYSPGKCTSLQFPWKMHVLLEQTASKGKSDIISWLPDGKSFKVFDKQRFEKEVMPHYFKTTTYKSFQRNCNLWGFETKSRGFDTGVIYHEYFEKGKTDRCQNMSRIPIKKRNSLQNGHSMQSDLNDQFIRYDASQTKPSETVLNANNTNCNDGPQNYLGAFLNQMRSENDWILGEQHITELLIQHQRRVKKEEEEKRQRREVTTALFNLIERSNLGHLQLNNLSNGLNHEIQSKSMESLVIGLLQKKLHEQNNSSNNAAFSSGLSYESHGRDSSFGNKAAPKVEKQGELDALPWAGIETPNDDTIRCACKARGMPISHNQRSAYFEISSNTKHGADLECSHEPCRAAGTKFCYCAYCKVPAAKRTFWSLHGHDDPQSFSRKRRKTSEKPTAKQVESIAVCQIITDKKESKSMVRPLERAKALSDKVTIREEPLAVRNLTSVVQASEATRTESISPDAFIGRSPPKVESKSLPLKKRRLLEEVSDSIATETPCDADSSSQMPQTCAAKSLNNTSGSTTLASAKVLASFDRFKSRVSSDKGTTVPSLDPRITWLKSLNNAAVKSSNYQIADDFLSRYSKKGAITTDTPGQTPRAHFIPME